jgi:hypothetical protein
MICKICRAARFKLEKDGSHINVTGNVGPGRKPFFNIVASHSCTLLRYSWRFCYCCRAMYKIQRDLIGSSQAVVCFLTQRILSIASHCNSVSIHATMTMSQL